jgi:hypothetical protein
MSLRSTLTRGLGPRPPHSSPVLSRSLRPDLGPQDLSRLQRARPQHRSGRAVTSPLRPMIRTAWLAAKARLGSLLAGGRPPAPRSGLRDPTSQASMAMSSTSSVAPDQPVTNAILDFTSSGELKSQSDELIERWALSSCRTNLQPTFKQCQSLPWLLALACVRRMS